MASHEDPEGSERPRREDASGSNQHHQPPSAQREEQAYDDTDDDSSTSKPNEEDEVRGTGHYGKHAQEETPETEANPIAFEGAENPTENGQASPHGFQASDGTSRATDRGQGDEGYVTIVEAASNKEGGKNRKGILKKTGWSRRLTKRPKPTVIVPEDMIEEFAEENAESKRFKMSVAGREDTGGVGRHFAWVLSTLGVAIEVFMLGFRLVAVPRIAAIVDIVADLAFLPEVFFACGGMVRVGRMVLRWLLALLAPAIGLIGLQWYFYVAASVTRVGRAYRAVDFVKVRHASLEATVVALVGAYLMGAVYYVVARGLGFPNSKRDGVPVQAWTHVLVDEAGYEGNPGSNGSSGQRLVVSLYRGICFLAGLPYIEEPPELLAENLVSIALRVASLFLAGFTLGLYLTHLRRARPVPHPMGCKGQFLQLAGKERAPSSTTVSAEAEEAIAMARSSKHGSMLAKNEALWRLPWSVRRRACTGLLGKRRLAGVSKLLSHKCSEAFLAEMAARSREEVHLPGELLHKAGTATTHCILTIVWGALLEDAGDELPRRTVRPSSTLPPICLLEFLIGVTSSCDTHVDEELASGACLAVLDAEEYAQLKREFPKDAIAAEEAALDFFGLPSVSSNERQPQPLVSNEVDFWKAQANHITSSLPSRRRDEHLRAFDSISGQRFVIGNGEASTDEWPHSRRNHDGWNVVHMAAENGQAKLCAELADAGADLEATDWQGRTPLQVALSACQWESANELARKKAPLGILARGMLEFFAYYAFNDNTDGVTAWLNAGRDPSAFTPDMRTPLHEAARANALTSVQALLNFRASPNCEDCFGARPAEEAARFGNVACVRAIVSMGGRVKREKSRGVRTFEETIENGEGGQVEALLEAGVDPNDAGADGRTPLHFAARRGDMRAAGALLEKGAATNAKDRCGGKPVGDAVMSTHLAIARLIHANGGEGDDDPRLEKNAVVNAMKSQAPSVSEARVGLVLTRRFPMAASGGRMADFDEAARTAHDRAIGAIELLNPLAESLCRCRDTVRKSVRSMATGAAGMADSLSALRARDFERASAHYKHQTGKDIDVRSGLLNGALVKLRLEEVDALARLRYVLSGAPSAESAASIAIDELGENLDARVLENAAKKAERVGIDFVWGIACNEEVALLAKTKAMRMAAAGLQGAFSALSTGASVVTRECMDGMANQVQELGFASLVVDLYSQLASAEGDGRSGLSAPEVACLMGLHLLDACDENHGCGLNKNGEGSEFAHPNAYLLRNIAPESGEQAASGRQKRIDTAKLDEDGQDSNENRGEKGDEVNNETAQRRDKSKGSREEREKRERISKSEGDSRVGPAGRSSLRRSGQWMRVWVFDWFGDKSAYSRAFRRMDKANIGRLPESELDGLLARCKPGSRVRPAENSVVKGAVCGREGDFTESEFRDGLTRVRWELVPSLRLALEGWRVEGAAAGWFVPPLKSPGFLLRPGSRPFRLWRALIDKVVSPFMVLDVPFEAAFNPAKGYGNWWLAMMGALNALLLVDMGLRFRTPYWAEGTGKPVADPGQMAKNYLKNGFRVDILSALPLDFLSILGALAAGDQYNRTLTTLLRMNRLLRVLRISWPRSRPGRFLVFGAFLLHFVACVVWLFGIATIRSNDPSMLETAFAPGRPNALEASPHRQYLFALHWSVTSICGEGAVGSALPKSPMELSLLLVPLSLSVTAFFFALSLIGELSLVWGERLASIRDKRSEVDALCRFVEPDGKSGRETSKCIRDVASLPDEPANGPTLRSAAVALSTAGVPRSIQERFMGSVQYNSVMACPLFQACSQAFVSQVAACTREHLVPVGSALETPGEVSKSIQILRQGTVTFYVPGFREHGIDADPPAAFGYEGVFWKARGHHEAFVRSPAGGKCSILAIPWAEWERLASAFPKQARSVRKQALVANAQFATLEKMAREPVQREESESKGSTQFPFSIRTTEHDDDISEHEDNAEDNGLNPYQQAASERAQALRFGADKLADKAQQLEKMKGLWELLEGVANGHREAVLGILGAGWVSADDADGRGRTALHVAGAYGQASLFEELIDSWGANPDAWDKEGRTPGLEAALSGSVRTAAAASMKCSDAGNAATVGRCLRELAAAGEEEIVDRLVRAGAKPWERAGSTLGRSPLHCAAIKGHVGTANKLIDHGAVVSAEDANGETPLLLAVDRRNKVMVDCLRRAGASLVKSTLLGAKAVARRSRAMAVRGEVEWLEVLRTVGIGFDTTDVDGRTPLHAACASGSAELTDRLLRHHEADPQTVDAFGRTPLDEANMAGNDALRMLAQRASKTHLGEAEKKEHKESAAKDRHEVEKRLRWKCLAESSRCLPEAAARRSAHALTRRVDDLGKVLTDCHGRFAEALNGIATALQSRPPGPWSLGAAAAEADKALLELAQAAEELRSELAAARAKSLCALPVGGALAPGLRGALGGADSDAASLAKEALRLRRHCWSVDWVLPSVKRDVERNIGGAYLSACLRRGGETLSAS